MTMTSTPTSRDLVIRPLAPDTFAPFGAVIAPQPDGTSAGPDDAELDLSSGVPRFYTMRIPGRGLEFGSITRHRLVTQVLGSAGGHEWYIAVAPPGDLDIDQTRAFRVPADTAIMLHVGTWHAGPLFDDEEQSFFNLELNNTNVVDHHTIDIAATEGLTLRLVDGSG